MAVGQTSAGGGGGGEGVLCEVKIVGGYIVEESSHEVWYFQDNELVHRTISGLQDQTPKETFQMQPGILIDRFGYKGGTGVVSGDAEGIELVAGNPNSINATKSIILISITGDCTLSMG